MTQEYNKYLAREEARRYACCECGYQRRGSHHPNIRCPKSGRCGTCGNEWPCAEHAKWRVFMAYGAFTDPKTTSNFIVMRVPEGHLAWSKKVVPAIARILKTWRDAGSEGRGRYFWNIDGDPNPEQSLWETKKARRFQWNGTDFVEVPQ